MYLVGVSRGLFNRSIQQVYITTSPIIIRMLPRYPNSTSKRKSNFIRKIYFNEMPPLPSSPSPPDHSPNFKLGHKSKTELIQTKKEWTKTLLRQEKQLNILDGEESALIDKIRRIKKHYNHKTKLSNEDLHGSFNNASSLKSNKIEKSLIARENSQSEFRSKYNDSVYEAEKRERVEVIKRENSWLKTLVQQRRNVDLKDKKNHVVEHHEHRSFVRQQMDLMRYLKKVKVEKEKESSILRYQQLNLESEDKQAALRRQYLQKQEIVDELRVLSEMLETKPELSKKVKLRNYVDPQF